MDNMHFSGKDNAKLTIITAYQVCQTSISQCRSKDGVCTAMGTPTNVHGVLDRRTLGNNLSLT
jgi:hypothetical protein